MLHLDAYLVRHKLNDKRSNRTDGIRDHITSEDNQDVNGYQYYDDDTKSDLNRTSKRDILMRMFENDYWI